MPLIAPASIESRRVVLRPVAQADLPALMRANGDDRVTRFLPYPSWQSRSDGEAWLQRISGLQAAGSCLQFVIVAKESDALIGACCLFHIDEANALAELGYLLAHAYWGKGYMKEALIALIDCAFGTLSLRRLEAALDARNAASAALLRRLGFVEEGLLRQRWSDRGELADCAQYGLLRHEWQGLGT